MHGKEESRQRPSATWHDDPIRIAPYVPTPTDIIAAMLKLGEATETDILIDLGCGDGRILFAAVTAFKVRRAIGYEIDPELCRQANEQAVKQGLDEHVKAINQDLFEADLSQASIVVLYLTTPGNERLRPKLENETAPGTRIVSHDFAVRDWMPEKIVVTRTEGLNEHTIYLYRNPESFPRLPDSRITRLYNGIMLRLLKRRPE